MATGLTLGHRSAGAILRRVPTIVARFGVTPERLSRRLALLDAVTAEYGCRPTFPITAAVLARHPDTIRPFVEREFEFALHGLVHNDHGRLGHDEQLRTLAEAGRRFERAGVPYCGFRGPYLRHNADTERATRDLGLAYNSSQAVAYPVVPDDLSPRETDAYARILGMYAALDASATVVRPRLREGLVDIPVAVPDDEILVERFGYHGELQAAAWLRMLDHACERGELLTLQLHPERAFECEHALRAVLAEARRRTPAVWLATLAELAAWWKVRSRARMVLEPTTDGSYRIRLDEGDRCVISIGEPGERGLTWRTAAGPGETCEVAGPAPPVIAVPVGSAPARLAFLREEGFPVVETPDPSACALSLGGVDNVTEVELLRRIDASSAPIARVGRWPEGAVAAMAVTGDIDSITLQDFAIRLWEAR